LFQKSGLESNETPGQECEAQAQESENISNWNELTEKLELLQIDFNDFVKSDNNIVILDGNTETDVIENNQITKNWIVIRMIARKGKARNPLE
jgi:hypothetical protein